MQAVLVSNGPGELYTWVKPVLAELRRYPHVRVHIGLIPCQFASGSETRIAATFGADSVSAPGDFARFMALGRRLPGLEQPAPNGFVLSLGGSAGLALNLGEKLGYPVYRYSFVPTWHRKLAALFVHDARAERRARLLGTPRERLEQIGNLVADAVKLAEPAPERGHPHVLLMPGSRDAFAVHLIPLMVALADALGERFPGGPLRLAGEPSFERRSALRLGFKAFTKKHSAAWLESSRVKASSHREVTRSSLLLRVRVTPTCAPPT